MKLLIFGSNFGLIHLDAAIKSKKFKQIAICSPNIVEKKIPQSVFKYNNIDDAISNFNYDMVTIATLPLIQHKILLKIKKKKLPKYIFLEKPLLNKTIKILKKSFNQTKYLTNFIFTFHKVWVDLKKQISFRKKYKSIVYNWFFNQAYFENKKDTWKIKNKEGGGLVNYYLPHAIFNLLYLDPNIYLYEVKKKKFYKDILIDLVLVLKSDNSLIELKMCNKSKKNLHLLKINYNKDSLHIHNKSKKWLSNFYCSWLKNKSKKFSYDRQEILNLVYKNYSTYFNKVFIDKFKPLTYKTFSIIRNINSSLK